MVGFLLTLIVAALFGPIAAVINVAPAAAAVFALVIGAFLLMGGNGLVTWSEKQVPSSIAALVVATMPLWMTLFDWLLFKGSKPGRQTAVGLFLGFVGIGLLVGPEQWQGTADFDLFSLLVLITAPVLWSLGSLYSRRAHLPENV